MLLQSLRGRRRPVTAAELARDLAVSERTIYRDIATLTGEGAPIDGEAGIGYVLRPGLFLPPLMLSEDEIEAVLLGLRYVDQRGDEILKSAAANALAKIGAVLSPEAQTRLAAPLSMPGPPGAGFPENRVTLGRLRDAMRGQRRLAISYQDASGGTSERVVWPLQLAFTDRARVLAAWCELRQDFRLFRSDRILAATERDRYPGSRASLLRRLRVHLDSSGS
jgi:predicted DNA-binding transcriptional regulator YafY